ncbi:putative Thaumatin family [Helianthus anomalus]
MVDLKVACPSELNVTSSDGEAVACKSACVAFGRKEDCYRGEYGSRDACKPSFYSQVFKTACPRASSYTYDDETSTFACTGADYQIIFCPTSTTKYIVSLIKTCVFKERRSRVDDKGLGMVLYKNKW